MGNIHTMLQIVFPIHCKIWHLYTFREGFSSRMFWILLFPFYLSRFPILPNKQIMMFCNKKMCFKMYQFNRNGLLRMREKLSRFGSMLSSVLSTAKNPNLNSSPKETRAEQEHQWAGTKLAYFSPDSTRLTTVKNTTLILFNQQWTCNMMLYGNTRWTMKKLLFICLLHLKGCGERERRPIYSFLVTKKH